MNAKKYIVVGEVSKPHGVRGELCIHCRASSPLLFDAVDKVRLTPSGQAQPAERGGRRNAPKSATYKVVSWRPHKDRALLILEGVSDRDAAEALRGRLVEIDAEALPKASPDEVFIHELLGCRVREAGATENEPDLGVLEDVLDEAGQELWVIRGPKDREILLPAVPEFVEDIDLEAGVIVVCPPPGLLELYAEAPGKSAEDEAEA